MLQGPNACRSASILVKRQTGRLVPWLPRCRLRGPILRIAYSAGPFLAVLFAPPRPPRPRRVRPECTTPPLTCLQSPARRRAAAALIPAARSLALPGIQAHGRQRQHLGHAKGLAERCAPPSSPRALIFPCWAYSGAQRPRKEHIGSTSPRRSTASCTVPRHPPSRCAQGRARAVLPRPCARQLPCPPLAVQWRHRGRRTPRIPSHRCRSPRRPHLDPRPPWEL